LEPKLTLSRHPDSPYQCPLQEFSPADNVELHILTKPFGNSGADFASTMHAWAAEHLGINAEAVRASAPTLYVISDHITSGQLSGLYRAADAYVIPTRGEVVMITQ
jgi:hypothetical protein